MDYIEQIKSQILNFFRGENVKIYLYGSYARGTQNQSSDVDIAVEFQANYNKNKIVAAEDFFAESSMPLTVNIADLNSANDAFKSEVKSTGILLKTSRFNQAEKALSKLAELADKKNLSEVERDSLILRFQFTFELLWKCGKDFLEAEHGFLIASPKNVVRKLRELGYFTDAETENLLQAANDRNLTAHIYDENKSLEIARRIKIYFPLLKKWLEIISQ